MTSPDQVPHSLRDVRPQDRPDALPAGTALVTGATAGIGLGFAVELAARGHDLVLVARDAPRLEDVAARLRGEHDVAVEVLPADLAERDQLVRVEARVADRERPVAIVVNNAGFGLRQRFLDNSVEAEQALLEVLVTAVMRISHAAIGAMAERGEGAVLNVSSVAGYLPRGTYGASKAWVTSFSRWASVEYRPRGVLVTALLPGFVRTEFHQRMDVEPGRGPLWLDVDRVVQEALADLARGRPVSIPSRRYRAIVRLTRLVPGSALQRLQGLGRR